MKMMYLDEAIEEFNGESFPEAYRDFTFDADFSDAELSYDEGDYVDFEEEENFGWLSNPRQLLEGYRKLLHEKFRALDWQQLDRSLSHVLDGMSEEEEFNFGNILSTIGSAGSKVLQNKTVSDIGRTVLPAAASLVGTVYGGPAGAAVGGNLGQLASQALFKGGAAASPSAPAAHAGSNPAAQLLQLTQNPSVLNALGSLAMGSMGSQTVQTGNNQSLPIGSILSMLGELTRQASEDADQLASESEVSYGYLKDSEGEYVVDVANPNARAQALYSILMK